MLLICYYLYYLCCVSRPLYAAFSKKLIQVLHPCCKIYLSPPCQALGNSHKVKTSVFTFCTSERRSSRASTVRFAFAYIPFLQPQCDLLPTIAACLKDPSEIGILRKPPFSPSTGFSAAFQSCTTCPGCSLSLPTKPAL